MTFRIRHILAKSTQDALNPAVEETLLGHTRSVMEAAEVICEILGPGIQESFCLTVADVTHWKYAVLVASWLHDFGKANDHFQKIIRKKIVSQGVRHELMSLVAAHELEEWLKPIWKKLPRWGKQATLFSMTGHHLKFPDPKKDRSGTDVTLLLGHREIRDFLNEGRRRFDLGDIPSLSDKSYSLLSRGDLKRLVNTIRIELDIENDEKERALIACAKTALMAADLAGSALPNKLDNPREWIRTRISQILTADDLQGVVRNRLKGNAPRPFQQQVADSCAPTTIATAGCGSGKTVAAYMWAANYATGKRLFFCYPTTGTASEGFSGYLHDPDFNAVLIHGRANVDYRLLENMPLRGQEERLLHQLRLEALETWPIPAVVCTAHTVLGMLENVRRGLYAWPSIARAAFIFDEVHAFSNSLFSYLLRFLETFKGSPVLLMTATLPKDRLQALQSICRKRGDIQFVSGPKTRESSPRYRMRKGTSGEAEAQMQSVLSAGGKVLWICNTVRRAMDFLEEALAAGLPVQPYHSRYRYVDRLKRQRTVIDGFLPSKPPMLAVTTQVAEMSLDLSADLLVSETAPIPSLIQRLGRLNRFGDEPKEVKDAIFITPEYAFPYEKNDLEIALRWIDQLCDGRTVSQSDLADTFLSTTEVGEEIPTPVPFCDWLDKPWQSRTGERAIEESSYTIEVVRRSDLCQGNPIENAIPMPFPKGDTWKNWEREKRFLIVPDEEIIYDEFRGARWRTH